MTRLYSALAWLYRLLLYVAVPYVAWVQHGLTPIQLLLVLCTVFYIDTVSEAVAWYIYREDEYEPLPGAYALYMFASVFTLLALLVEPTMEMVYLPIIALLGALAIVGKHGIQNRKFRIGPALGGAVLMLAAASIFLTPLTLAIASIVTPLLLLFAVASREYIVYRTSLIVRLVLATLLAVTMTALSMSRILTLTLYTAMLTGTVKIDVAHIPELLLTMLLVASFEEFIGRAFIPYVGAGLATHIFATLHIPKLTYIEAMAETQLGLPLPYTALMIMGAGLCISLISAILVSVWRRGGLLASIIAHALYDTLIVMIAGGQAPIAIAVATILSITHYILSRKNL